MTFYSRTRQDREVCGLSGEISALAFGELVAANMTDSYIRGVICHFRGGNHPPFVAHVSGTDGRFGQYYRFQKLRGNFRSLNSRSVGFYVGTPRAKSPFPQVQRRKTKNKKQIECATGDLRPSRKGAHTRGAAPASLGPQKGIAL